MPPSVVLRVGFYPTEAKIPRGCSGLFRVLQPNPEHQKSRISQQYQPISRSESRLFHVPGRWRVLLQKSSARDMVVCVRARHPLASRVRHTCGGIHPLPLYARGTCCATCIIPGTPGTLLYHIHLKS
jgi:hypothetical protein